MSKVIKKSPHHSGYEGWNIETDDGKKWSVLNFADSMKDHPYPVGIYMGWEAMSSGEGGMIIIRRESEEDIIRAIKEY